MILQLCKAMMLGVMLLSVAGLFDSRGRQLELLSHFRFQYLLLALAGSIFLLSMKSWKWSAAAVSCAITNTAFIAPLYIQGHNGMKKQAGIPVRLLYANVNVANHNFSALRDFVQTEQPDIAAFLELDPQWFKALAPLKVNYPYQHYISL